MCTLKFQNIIGNCNIFQCSVIIATAIGIFQPDNVVLVQIGVVSEKGKNRTLSRWHGCPAHKLSFSRSLHEKARRANVGPE